MKEKAYITEQRGIGEGWPFAGADKVPSPNQYKPNSEFRYYA